MINKISFLFLFFLSLYIKAQNNDFISLKKDQYGNALSYKFDKALNNEFFFWFKIDYTEKNDPAFSSNEYYINAKCDNISSAMLSYKNDWRIDDEDDKVIEVPTNDIIYVPVKKNEKIYFLFDKYCK